MQVVYNVIQQYLNKNKTHHYFLPSFLLSQLSQDKMLTSLQNVLLYNDKPIINNLDNNETENNRKPEILSCYVFKGEKFEQLVNELEQNREIVKIIKFRILRMMKNAITAFQANIKQQQANRILSRYFSLLKYQTFIQKIQNKFTILKVFNKLKQNREHKLQKNMHKVMIMTADNLYQRSLKFKVLFQWKETIKIEKKMLRLFKQIQKQRLHQFKAIHELKKENKFEKQLINSIVKQKLLKKYFNGLAISVKYMKTQKILFSKFSKIFIKHFTSYYRNQKQRYEHYCKKKLLKKYLEKLKQNKKLEQYCRFHNKKLMRHCFNVWVEAGRELFYQKVKIMKNQEKVQEFWKRKNKIILLYYFQKWKCQVEEAKQNRKKYDIAKQYGEVRQKQFLLKKYFNAWKELKLYNKAQKFYENKLKNRILFGLKQLLIKSAEKWDNLYKFVENRQKRKYFDAIKLFIKNDLIKVLQFRTQKIWNRFTFAITKNYVVLNTKATQFHIKNLKYKSLYAFNDIIKLKNKINKTIIFVNANMTLKRWRKYCKIRQFVQQRKFVILGKIFREIKLLRMNKIWLQSNKKETAKKIGNFYQKNNTFASISVFPQKLCFESPQKNFNLEYSVSAYNSNNNHDDF